MKTAILIILSTFYVCAKAQTIQFIDKLNNLPVSYATVSWNGESTFTDETGTIVLGSGNVKQIKFSHICYNDTIISIAKGSQKVFVTPKSYTLDNVEICAKSCKKLKLRNVGLANSKTKFGFGGKNGMMMALYIAHDNVNETSYIHSIQACLDYINEKIKNRNVIDAELRFDIRNCTFQNGKRLPGNQSYINGGVVYKGKKKSGLKTIPLSHPIVFPKEGVFVTIEWICPGKSRNDVTNAGIKGTLQTSNVQTYTNESGKWELIKDVDSIKRIVQEYLNGKYPNIKIGLQISR